MSAHYYSNFEDIDGIPPEEEVLRREKEFAKENNLYFSDGMVFGDTNDNIFRLLRYALKNRDTRKVQAQLNALVARFDIPAPQSMAASAIKQSSDSLKAYIQQLFSLETNIYSACRHLSDLYAQQWETNGAVHCRKGLTEMDIRQRSAHIEREYQTATEKHARIQEVSPEAYYLDHRGTDSKPKPPVFEKPGLFNKKKMLAQNEELQTKYQQAMLNFQQDAEAYYAQALSAAEAVVAKAKAQMEQSAAGIDVQIEAACALPSPETVAKQMLDDEIAQAEKLLKELIECRNKLYARDVVFIKYRNMVALATFYEYLISGRCTTLEGPNGAYNIFEDECRANQIIGQLNKIVDSLEQIKESQYLIYSQLQNINSSLTTMNTTMQNMSQSLQSIQADTHNMSGYMEKVAQNSNVIAHNTAVSAYYAKMNAELTNSLGYLVALH